MLEMQRAGAQRADAVAGRGDGCPAFHRAIDGKEAAFGAQRLGSAAAGGHGDIARRIGAGLGAGEIPHHPAIRGLGKGEG